MALESEYFPEQSSYSNSSPAEDGSAYRKILYGIFGFYVAAVVSLAGMVIAGTNIQQAAHIVMATLN